MTTLKPDAFEEVSWLLGTISQQPSPFHLSQIFLKLEEESERRAIEAEEAALSPNITDLAIAAQRAAQRRQRNRGSVSVSRFGHVRIRSFFSHESYDSSRTKIEEDTQHQASSSPLQMPTPVTTFYGVSLVTCAWSQCVGLTVSCRAES